MKTKTELGVGQKHSDTARERHTRRSIDVLPVEPELGGPHLLLRLLDVEIEKLRRIKLVPRIECMGHCTLCLHRHFSARKRQHSIFTAKTDVKGDEEEEGGEGETLGVQRLKN